MWRLYGELLVLLAFSFVVGCAVGAVVARLLTRGRPEATDGVPATSATATGAPG